MRKLLLFALFLLIGVGYSNKAFATHIPGANITYTCDPNNPLTYTFTLTLYRVCPGTHPATMSSTYFTLTNDCGLVNPVVPIFNQVGQAEDVNQLCASATSDCSGGTSPGLWKYTYEATITLPADCDSWTISFDLCCRDASTNMTGGTGNNMYVETVMNTQTAPCNSSPQVTSIPMPYACANTTFNYCLTIADPEGDSTYFTMIPPMGAAGTPIAFNAPWSTTSPLSNFTLDPLTGCISFNEPTTGDYVVNILIESFDANGNLIASIVHDFKIQVMACNNTPPSNPVGGIQNVTGTGAQLGPQEVGVCWGDDICFDVVFQDAVNPADIITITTDGTTLLPGATFVQTGTNPATGTFCWTAQPGYTGSVVTFVAADDGCPVMGTSGFAVEFSIATGVWAGPDPIICGSQTTQLQANGAGSYTWSPATGLSCTNCPNPIADPPSTQQYIVTGNLVGTCPNEDTVTVIVVPDFTPLATPASQSICANEIAQLDITGNQGPYTVTWTPQSTLNNPNIVNPLANPLTTTTYTAVVTSIDGCTKTITADVIVSGVGPTVTITPSSIDICEGESVPFVTEAYVYPVVCGPSSGCTGTNNIVDIGTSSTGTTSYTPFYGSTSTTSNYTNKTQYIYTAAELNAMGYYGGTIKTLALRSTTSYIYQYDNVDIWIGCTTQDQYLTTSFIPTSSMTLVWSGDNYNPPNNTWCAFNIADYDWDGISNLVIQICADEDNTNDEGSDSFLYHSTSPAYRCLYYHTTLTTGCSTPTGTRVTNRPNIRMTLCVEDASSPVYSWSPGTGLSSTTIANPTASPTSSTSYVLDVTANGCTGSGIAQINVSPDYTLSPTASPISLCYGQTTTLNAGASGPGPYTYSWEPAGAFGNPSASSPTVSPTGETTYYISTSNGFCNKLDSVTVQVGGIPIAALANLDTVCPLDVVQLDMVAATGNCGVNYANCTGASSTGVSGTATTATSSYGPFYGSTSASTYYNKKQYIFSADELTTMGFTAGTITMLELNVSTGTARSYDDLTIWMGCTTQEQYTTTSFIPVSSLTQVYYNPYYTTANGWNSFNITGFDWDGSSNIVVQFCAHHDDHIGSENTYYSTTSPYYRCMYYNTTLSSACNNATGTRTTVRPNMRFTMCNATLGGGATYSWSPSTGLSDPSIQNPTATVTGTTTYTLTVTDPANPGCPSTSQVQVAIDPSNSVTAAPDTMICPGDSYNLNALFTGPVPTTIPCGLNTAGYSGPNTLNLVGTGTTATSTYGPFYGSYSDVKYQFLYHASDLQAAGFQSGTITELSFNILSNFTTGAFNDFQISIGCTNENTLVAANGWLPTVGPVWGPQNYNVAVGWNTFILSQPFDWDGTSNIVIETCFDNNSAISYANHYYHNSPGFGTTMRNYQNLSGGGPGSSGCSLDPVYVYQYRPNIRLRIYDPPPVSPTYTWTPATSLDDPNIANPTATPLVDQQYVVEVTGGICTVYDTVNIIICNPLPIELMSFAGENNGDVNDLYWTTATEINNDFFLVQRSEDGYAFKDIGQVDAAGNSSVTNSYRLTDNAPLKGMNYYRLKQIDFNGSASYSEVIAINTNIGPDIQIYPNPTSGDLFIDFNDENDGVHTILITDISGKTIVEEIELSPDKKTYMIDNFSNVSTGIYIVKVLNNQNEIIKFEKITKQ